MAQPDFLLQARYQKPAGHLPDRHRFATALGRMEKLRDGKGFGFRARRSLAGYCSPPLVADDHCRTHGVVIIVSPCVEDWAFTATGDGRAPTNQEIPQC
jgi:hypothetical protein